MRTTKPERTATRRTAHLEHSVVLFVDCDDGGGGGGAALFPYIRSVKTIILSWHLHARKFLSRSLSFCVRPLEGLIGYVSCCGDAIYLVACCVHLLCTRRFLPHLIIITAVCIGLYTHTSTRLDCVYR